MIKYRTVIAFDFGTTSIGVAIGQELAGTTRALAALKARDGKPDWQQIAKLLREWQPDLLIVGLPLNMDGSEQQLTAMARKFANRLHGRFGFQIELHDERLSSVEARSRLFSAGGYRALDKGRVDSTAAMVILQSWFHHHTIAR